LHNSIITKTFIALSALGTAGAVYHASLEKAFTTNFSMVHYSALASFLGIPYWVFGVVWFPVILAVALMSTRMGSAALKKETLMLLTVGNLFTAYLLYLDIIVVRGYTLDAVSLYAINYALTGLVVYQNWSNDIMHGFAYGTVIGAVVGILFGPLGIAACGIAGGIFGAIRNYELPKQPRKEHEVARIPVLRT
jgi:uncharacterized membrane protein